MIIIGTFSIIHRGYIEILNKYPEARIAVISDEFAKRLYKFEPDLRKLPLEKVQQALGFLNRSITELNEEGVEDIKSEDTIILIDDDAVSVLKENYLSNQENVKVENGFYYHDTHNVQIATKPTNAHDSLMYSHDDVEFIHLAQKEAQKSGCFWRQTGSVIVKDNQVVFSGCNQMLPHKDECYRIGCIRDQIKPGEKPEICSAIHAEANVIAQAARKGISLEGASIYMLAFPCPMCAKLIAVSGLKKCFYTVGSSNFDGERVLEMAGVKMIKVDLPQ